MVCLTDIWVEEQLSSIFVRPILRNDVFLLRVFLDESYDFLEAAMVTNELERRVWADLRDWIDVITAKEDAEIDELVGHIISQRRFGGSEFPTCFFSIPNPSRTRSR